MYFEGLDSMVDVGGGTGNMAKGIADAFPKMKCIVLDLLHVVANLKGTNNLSYVGGYMFESIPRADAVFLKWILHDWNDEDCVKILKRCKDAISGRSGKVIIVEMVIDGKNGNNKAIETQLFFDIMMMVDTMGREIIEKEWGMLFNDASFTRYTISPIGFRSMIEVYP